MYPKIDNFKEAISNVTSSSTLASTNFNDFSEFQTQNACNLTEFQNQIEPSSFSIIKNQVEQISV